MPVIAEVAVSGTAYSFDMLFSYKLPEQCSVRPGCRVLVPFGRGNRRRIGVIMSLSSGDRKGLKAIAGIVDSEPVVPEELLKLIRRME